MSLDRRREPRLPIQVQVDYEHVEDFLDDVTANISVGGMFIQTSEPLEIGTRFRLRFQLPSLAQPIDTVGEVRWVIRPEERGGRVPGMGVRFEVLPLRVQREIERLLASWEEQAGAGEEPGVAV